MQETRLNDLCNELDKKIPIFKKANINFNESNKVILEKKIFEEHDKLIKFLDNIGELEIKNNYLYLIDYQDKIIACLCLLYPSGIMRSGRTTTLINKYKVGLILLE